ncbi:ribonuclease HI [Paraperlucidibaca baekdonensis]|uniref:Ribonuclease H n=1 Tax=Paraperlucidibaca baekdonensis TaxID=748120 RepID=A0A3E0H1H6_9GAMM|nr:ribonuclease HI [Paraperlucidibaca baekdonensis]REH36962.1 ribonuclease HI [Paraperlucidibaca baekdonensis]
MNEVVIYTDGACRGNPGPGGWGALLRSGVHEKSISGYEPATTNNRMELTAALMALRALKSPSRVVLWTDSEYLRKGMSEWLPGWQARGWKTAAKQPVKNADIWQALIVAAEPHVVDWRWVKGHAGDPGNEAVDKLATEAIDTGLAR